MAASSKPVVAAAAITTAKPRRRPAITTEYVDALKAYANVLYLGGLCPKPGKGDPPARPETVAAILEVGKDIGLPPTQALANIRITNGRPAIYGDAGLALIRASGLLDDIEETFEGEAYSDNFTAVCRMKRKGAARDRVERFSVADAKRAGLWGKDGPWQTATRRMLMFRARGFACRDEFGDVLCGLIFVEEAMDIAAAAGQEDAPRVTAPVEVRQVQPEALPPAVADTTVGQSERQAPPQLPVARADLSAIDRGGLLELLAGVRGHLLTARNIADPSADEAKAAWREALAPFAITTVKDVDDAKLREIVAALAEKHGPPF